jgi:hypothetical protein
LIVVSHKITPAGVIVAKKSGYKKTFGEAEATEDLTEDLAQREDTIQHGAESGFKY